MIKPIDFVKALNKTKIRFVTGIPDSLLKEVCGCIDKRFGKNKHIIATNEGSAVALSIGHYLATKSPALVYMQNSGLGNSFNPIVSLADPKVYGIPIILMIGWRGEIAGYGKQIHDEPQHKKQGLITISQLKTVGIPFRIINNRTKKIKIILKDLKNLAIKRKGPVAIIVRKKTFSSFMISKKSKDKNYISREQAIKEIIKKLPKNLIVVSTTGMISRELFELRKMNKQNSNTDFLTVGAMGHANQIAAGIALAKPQKKILCIDGDGSVLMHMGSLAISSQFPNLTHIILNNESHDSVGGQPTKGDVIDFTKIAKACGYKNNKIIKKKSEINKNILKEISKKSSSLVVIKCKKGHRSNLGRPKPNLSNRMKMFMNYVNK
jgi:phosphonopyruvate decarboxylase